MRKVQVKKPKTVPYQEYLNLIEKYAKLKEEHIALNARNSLLMNELKNLLNKFAGFF